MILRTLALLRSLQSAHHSLEDAQATVQKACDYRWLREQLTGGLVRRRSVALDDGTPAVTIVLAFTATQALRRGGRWPADPEEREHCHVEGAHACRAAGAPSHRRLQSVSQGLAQGAMSVLKDAARFDYLLTHGALRLTWRRVGSLDEELASKLSRRLSGPNEEARHQGLFLLEVRVPAPSVTGSPSGEWLDSRLDQHRRILPSFSRG
jgi:hypothetical protein